MLEVNINLLPIKQPKNIANYLTITLVVCSLVIGGTTIAIRTYESKKEIQSIETQIQQIQVAIADSKQTQNQNESGASSNIDDQKRVIIDESILTSNLIDNMSKALPKGAKVTDFHFENIKNTMTMSVLVHKENEAGQFVEQCQAFNWIDQMNMTSLVYQDANEYLAIYQININKSNLPTLKGD